MLVPYGTDANLLFYCKSKSEPVFYEVGENNEHLDIPMVMNNFLAHINIHLKNQVIQCNGTLEDGQKFVARAYIFGAGMKICNALHIYIYIYITKRNLLSYPT